MAIQSTFCLRNKGPALPHGKGNAADPDSLVRRVILPALDVCGYCSKTKGEHTAEGHKYERNDVLPKWHGWHAFRRGLASVLYGLGADDLTVLRILRHSKVHSYTGALHQDARRKGTSCNAETRNRLK